MIFAMTLAAFVLLPSGKARGWLRVLVAKHLFEHRYDYRQEWLRFTDTVGRGARTAPRSRSASQRRWPTLAARPARLLLLADEQRRLPPAARWNWTRSLPVVGRPAPRPCSLHGQPIASCSISTTSRGGDARSRGARIAVPGLARRSRGAWAGIPLSHGGRLVALVVLAASAVPPAARLGGFRPVPHRRHPGGELYRRGARPAGARRRAALRRVQPPLRLHPSRHQEFGQPAQPGRAQRRASRRQSRVPRRHDRHPAKLGAAR